MLKMLFTLKYLGVFHLKQGRIQLFSWGVAGTQNWGLLTRCAGSREIKHIKHCCMTKIPLHQVLHMPECLTLNCLTEIHRPLHGLPSFFSYQCLKELGREHFRSRFLHTCLCRTGRVPKWQTMKKSIGKN